MNLLYKPDWEETKERYITWWSHGYFGRCAIGVTAPKDLPSPTLPPTEPRTPEEKWYDLEWISAWNDYQMSHTFYGGEAFPIWHAGYPGNAAIPTILGCPLRLDMETGWWDPILTEPNILDVSSLKLDESHPDYRFTMTLLRRAAQEARGRSIPSTGAFGGGGDTLAALRGSVQLLFDCIERPEAVYQAEMALMEMWCRHYDTRYAITHESAGGSAGWYELWSPGKFYASHNDFSYNISPGMFRDLFLPAIEMQTRFLDHSVYHVDGIGAFVHVDALCELTHLQAIQILPGAGKPSPLNYLDILKKVQRAGKNLDITIPPDEVQTALELLSARGLFIHTWCETETLARQLLKNVETWSVDRG